MTYLSLAEVLLISTSQAIPMSNIINNQPPHPPSPCSCSRTHSSSHDSSVADQILWNVQRKLRARIAQQVLLLIGTGETQRLTVR